jgi:hypothetical protein
MKSGYVLDFSDRTFTFVGDSVGIDIFMRKVYYYGSGRSVQIDCAILERRIKL